ncbi:conjugal transfer protein TraG, partial [Salmonella enterica subsp. enterica serovar Newport]|nr:conjugal transfer protein TraG [Salmonella enterica subsp. enterica serovar Newport]
KTIVTITFAQFALIFISFWWEVAGWLDDTLLKMTYDSITDFTKSVNDGWIMNIVLGTMYIAFPLVWFTTMGWTGVKIGSLVSGGIDKAGSMSQQAGAAGPKAAEGAAKAVATKGKSLMNK